MTSPFVWFHHNGTTPRESQAFFTSLLAIEANAGPAGMTMLTAGAGPFAALGAPDDRYGDRPEWIPFVAVDDVDAATARAVALGATIVRPKQPGPAGEFSVVRDPGGGALGLWKRR